MAEVARQRAVVGLEQRITRPDLFLRGDVGRNRERAQGLATSFVIGPQFGVEAGISLPVFNRNRGGIAWKVHQKYSDGMSSDWVGAAGSRSPAPVTKLLPADVK